MAHAITTVDAFTSVPFHGNPAAVCVLEPGEDAPDEWLRDVAAELNLSETAFVQRGAEGEPWHLRWWTPTVEVDLCGHATLATAHVLWADGLVPPGRPCRFRTRSGELVCRQGEGGWVSMDLPADPVVPEDDRATGAALVAALGPEEVLGIWRGRDFHVVELASEAAVRALRPDLSWLVRTGCSAIVTAPAGQSRSDGADVASRVFAPVVGIPEDPVTGSAHCTLASFWTPRLGERTLLGAQVSARGGLVRMRLAGDRVEVAGQAVTVARLTLLA